MNKQEKALKFVEHIESHIKKGDKGLPSNAKVMCKICGKTIDEILCEEEGHDFGEEIHKEVEQGTFTGTMIMPPHQNTREAVVKRYKQCKRCGYKQYV